MCWNTGSLYIFRNIYHDLGLDATRLQKTHRSERILRCASSIAKQNMYCKFVSQPDQGHKNISRELNPLFICEQSSNSLDLILWWVFYDTVSVDISLEPHKAGPYSHQHKLSMTKSYIRGQDYIDITLKRANNNSTLLRGIRKVIDYDNKSWSRRVPFKPDDTGNFVHNLLR